MLSRKLKFSKNIYTLKNLYIQLEVKTKYQPKALGHAEYSNNLCMIYVQKKKNYKNVRKIK